MSDCALLVDNIDKIHTTKMGIDRIKKNLKLDDTDAVEYCKDLFMGCLTFLKPRRYMVLFNFRQTVIMLEKDSPGANSIPLQSFLMGNDKRINYSDQYPIPGLYSAPMMPSLSKS